MVLVVVPVAVGVADRPPGGGKVGDGVRGKSVGDGEGPDVVAVAVSEDS